MLYSNLINSKLLKEFSPIPLNYDTAEVKNYISIAQDIWIRPILGDEYMDELLEQVTEDNLTPENSTALVEAIYPYLAFAVCLEALPFIWSHFSQVGITLGKSDNSESVSLKDMTYIENHLRKQVEVRKDLCIKWMDDHYESFPLYHPTHCSCNTCCNKKGKLNNPNPYLQMYSTNRTDTDLQ